MRRRHEQLAFAGSMHFVTLVAGIRGHWFVESDVCEHLLNMFESYRSEFGLTCHAYVLMPDHLHVLLSQTEDGSLVARLVGEFKKWSSRSWHHSQFRRTTLWRRGYDDVPVPGSDAARTKVNYAHANPVRRGLVAHAEDYRWSSVHDYAGESRGIVTVIPI